MAISPFYQTQQSSQYVDQFIPLPLDFYQAQLERKQESLDKAKLIAEDSKNKLFVQPGPSTTPHADKINSYFGGKSSEIVSDLITGKDSPTITLGKVANLQKEFQTNPEVQAVALDNQLTAEAGKLVNSEGFDNNYQEFFNKQTRTFNQIPADQPISKNDILTRYNSVAPQNYSEGLMKMGMSAIISQIDNADPTYGIQYVPDPVTGKSVATYKTTDGSIKYFTRELANEKLSANDEALTHQLYNSYAGEKWGAYYNTPNVRGTKTEKGIVPPSEKVFKQDILDAMEGQYFENTTKGKVGGRPVGGSSGKGTHSKIDLREVPITISTVHTTESPEGKVNTIYTTPETLPPIYFKHDENDDVIYNEDKTGQKANYKDFDVNIKNYMANFDTYQSISDNVLSKLPGFSGLTTAAKSEIAQLLEKRGKNIDENGNPIIAEIPTDIHSDLYKKEGIKDKILEIYRNDFKDRPITVSEDQIESDILQLNKDIADAAGAIRKKASVDLETKNALNGTGDYKGHGILTPEEKAFENPLGKEAIPIRKEYYKNAISDLVNSSNITGESVIDAIAYFFRGSIPTIGKANKEDIIKLVNSTTSLNNGKYVIDDKKISKNFETIDETFNKILGNNVLTQKVYSYTGFNPSYQKILQNKKDAVREDIFNAQTTLLEKNKQIPVFTYIEGVYDPREDITTQEKDSPMAKIEKKFRGLLMPYKRGVVDMAGKTNYVYDQSPILNSVRITDLQGNLVDVTSGIRGVLSDGIIFDDADGRFKVTGNLLDSEGNVIMDDKTGKPKVVKTDFNSNDFTDNLRKSLGAPGMDRITMGNSINSMMDAYMISENGKAKWKSSTFIPGADMTLIRSNSGENTQWRADFHLDDAVSNQLVNVAPSGSEQKLVTIKDLLELNDEGNYSKPNITTKTQLGNEVFKFYSIMNQLSKQMSTKLSTEKNNLLSPTIEKQLSNIGSLATKYKNLGNITDNVGTGKGVQNLTKFESFSSGLNALSAKINNMYEGNSNNYPLGISIDSFGKKYSTAPESSANLLANIKRIYSEKGKDTSWITLNTPYNDIDKDVLMEAIIAKEDGKVYKVLSDNKVFSR